MGNKTKLTPLGKAIAEIEARIKYLFEQEILAINELDAIANPLLRQVHWSMIKELATRRGELEMYSLKPLQSLLPYERECIEGAYKEGQEDVEIKNDKIQYFLSAQDYFTSTYKQ